MVESQIHKELKDHAKKILIERGFEVSSIMYEQNVKIGKAYFIVDVVGYRNGALHTAIECGLISNKDKLSQLKTIFEVVEHIPYIDNNPFSSRINKYEKIIFEQDQIINNLKSILRNSNDHDPSEIKLCLLEQTLRDSRGRKPTSKSTPEMRKVWREIYRQRIANKEKELQDSTGSQQSAPTRKEN